jgi:hypothetical protein
MTKKFVVRTMWMRECVQVQLGEPEVPQRGRRKKSAECARAVPVCLCLSVLCVCASLCVS